MLEVWENKDDKASWTRSKSMIYNLALKDLGYLWSCKDVGWDGAPTKYNVTPMYFTKVCHTQGSGTKNIVLVGNSHARAMYYGIEHAFHGLYKTLTLLALHQCTFIQLQKMKKTYSKERYNGCKILNRDIVKMFKMWNYPIDIIIIGHAFPIADDPEFDLEDLKDDVEYHQLQKLHTGLSGVAREVVFTPVSHFDSGIRSHMQTLQREIMYNQNLKLFRTPISYVRSVWPNAQQRIRHINCTNCILMDWVDLYCDKKTGFCDSIDFERKLSFFFDSNHHNAYGSLHVGHFIRKLYDKWAMKNETNGSKLNNNLSSKASKT
ncbi:hypothetical protein M3Y97_00964500 [Aphelenchoides bicaudatus]|nr:hypothetical protein M3Y97_00964500 [Aphelenchoides bicaudatus]